MTLAKQLFSDKKKRLLIIRIITYVGSLLPLVILFWDFRTNQLGADPVREIILRTGIITLALLILSLACTPVSIWTGWKQAVLLRKPLGLFAFLYVCLHFLSFIWLDYGLDWTLIIQDGLVKQRYIIVGFIAFLLLIPLAATSTKWAMRKLGKNWKRLHKLVYLIGILGIIHFTWLVKNVYIEPIIYGTILAILLLTRHPRIKQPIQRWRRNLGKKKAPVSVARQ